MTCMTRSPVTHSVETVSGTASGGAGTAGVCVCPAGGRGARAVQTVPGEQAAGNGERQHERHRDQLFERTHSGLRGRRALREASNESARTWNTSGNGQRRIVIGEAAAAGLVLHDGCSKPFRFSSGVFANSMLP